jgi:peroxiredoxin
MGYKTMAPPPDADGYRRLTVGDPAPWFEQVTSTGPRLRLDLAAGRYLVLCFFVGTDDPAGQRAFELVAQNRDLFDDETISFFGVALEWRDRSGDRAAAPIPGVRYYWDFDLKVSRLYGVVPANATPGTVTVRRSWFILDPSLRIIAAIRFQKDGSERASVIDILRNLPPTHASSGIEPPPPILYLPSAFEPDLCQRLVEVFDAGTDGGGIASAIRPVDHFIKDTDLATEVSIRIQRRIAPEMAKVFQFQANRTSRHVVSCYDPAVILPARRDSPSVASPRFTLFVGLNEDYEGAEIAFLEYGRYRYQPPLGTAILFSSSILHRVSPVSRGRCYRCVSFVYGEATDHVPVRTSAPSIVEDQKTPLMVSVEQGPPNIPRAGSIGFDIPLPEASRR